ncbi:MAG: zinc dependent phospholipase C family protein [Candidatus Saccharibacteria bacterium]
MNSGLVTYFTKGKVLNTVGTHQKFDKTAYRLILPMINPDMFPSRSLILKFEGMGGPDGLKIKSRKYKADHHWDPINKIGELPLWIDIHFNNLVDALKKGDMVKAAFEAGFMSHYITDSLTPAHHVSMKLMTAEHQNDSRARKGWLYLGRKGLLSSHVMFEGGVSTSIAMNRIRVTFDQDLYEKILNEGIKSVIGEESLRIAKLEIYEQFLKKGWTASLAKTVKTIVVKRIPQLLAATYLAAYKESGGEVRELDPDYSVII